MFANGFEVAVIVLIAIVAAIFFAGMYTGKHNMKQEAVERGYALYCADIGKFAWKDECGKDKVK